MTFNGGGDGRNAPLSAVRLLTTAAAYVDVRRRCSPVRRRRRWRYKERGDCELIIAVLLLWPSDRHQPRAPIFVVLRSHPFFPSHRTHSAAAHSRVTGAVTYRCLQCVFPVFPAARPPDYTSRSPTSGARRRPQSTISMFDCRPSLLRDAAGRVGSAESNNRKPRTYAKGGRVAGGQDILSGDSIDSARSRTHTAAAVVTTAAGRAFGAAL